LIIVAGAILDSIIFVIFIAQGKLVNLDFFLTISTVRTVLFNITQLSIPLAASIYLGLEFAFVNDSLQQKLKEVNELSEKSLTQEREKQQLLASQNETLERQVAERTSELSRSLTELKETQTQLIQQEKMASLGQLTAGIAHEIQNPLNFVNNFSEVNKELLAEMNGELDKGNYSDVKAIAKDISDNQEKINHHGKRADAIVKGMLQHSRTSSGQKEPTDINALADEYLRLAYHGYRAKDKSFNAIPIAIGIETDFDNSLSADEAVIGKINVIPQDIGRVLVNLINNAFYAASLPSPENIGTGKGGFSESDSNKTPTVWVSTKKENNKILISVRDNGPGIPANILDKIFQPFFTTKPTGQGTGLGLSLSYDIVKAHGGEIKVETKEGEGSEFIIILSQ
jgi:signal transduction histidine kinase